MANISTYLQAIMNAVYGEEVRGSIHDAISIINDVGEKVLTVGTAVTSPSSSTEGFFNESLYLNKNTWELWKCNGSGWVSQGNIKGRGIESVTKKSTSGLVDTYEIDYDKGTSTEFQVTNGNGIKSFTKTGTSGLSDIYTITFDDGTTKQITVANGKGISSITKSGTVGRVDTYKIQYNDGTNSTFTVTNGKDGFSPIVSVSKTGKDTTITITTAEGPTTFHVLDGADGQGSGDMLTSVYDKDQDGIVDAAETAGTAETAGSVPWSGVTGKSSMVDDITTVFENDKITAKGVAILSYVNRQGTEHGANWLKYSKTGEVITPNAAQLYLVEIEEKPTLWNWNGTEYVNVTSGGGTSGIVPIENGGTGNDAGYIRTGQKSGTTIGNLATAEGSFVTASGDYSHAEGDSTKATNSAAHAEGNSTEASGMDSHAEGFNATASGNVSHAEGSSTTAGGAYSHAEGSGTTASGMYSHTEGQATSATKDASHAEGYGTVASGKYSHAEGRENTASGVYSHAEGYENTASGPCAHAGGHGTIAAYDNQTAVGIYNNNKSDTLFEVGNGSNGGLVRANAFEVYSNGNVNINGNIQRKGNTLFYNKLYRLKGTTSDFNMAPYAYFSSKVFTVQNHTWDDVFSTYVPFIFLHACVGDGSYPYYGEFQVDVYNIFKSSGKICIAASLTTLVNFSRTLNSIWVDVILANNDYIDFGNTTVFD